ncbi:tyrosine-type recombinase/integrase [Anaerotalea alkaliphila]|uniref:Tyrosine-type recombinase/integrase n=1 Tax=Anaerotalea alkaliphila TaxID=2662126 RepID=A0A7X5HWL8_9FIRM|nr:tyrosine-type recombinase/integrase [Anaerotalea alkaliphila]NDL67928.1 tyrosine-type recombinase/integrase [Anaerotalea alkaliphila]
MAGTNNYHEQQNIQNAVKLRELLQALPAFSYEFFRGIEPTTSSKTRIAYAYDLGVFFEFLRLYHPDFMGIQTTDITLDLLDRVAPDHVEQYLEYLKYYVKEGSKEIAHINHERGKSRKLATLRSFYKYFYKKRKLKTNPMLLVDMPKIHEKNIIRLEVDEIARLLDEVESGENLTDKQKQFHAITRDRDLALVTLLLGTGIRVSECVGLNLGDLDFNVNGIRILRKGGSEVIIYFGEEVEWALRNYLENGRKQVPVQTVHGEALFISLQGKRLSVRSVQNLVKKYAGLITHLKSISPHKLRSTYGTNLYRETGDIYLVADVLGHKDVNTTKRHYAQIEDERRRQAARSIRLREQ